MTEAEAVTKWCPFSRLCGIDDAGNGAVFQAGNRAALLRGAEAVSFNENPESCRCLASACMAWRWNDQWTSQTQEGHGGDLVLRLKRKPGEPKLGYCGLAGQPT